MGDEKNQPDRGRNPSGRGGGRASASLPLLDDAPASPASRRLASARPALAPKRQLIFARTLSFYGHVDFIPTEEYTAEEGRRAIAEARLAVETARGVIQATPKSRKAARRKSA